MRWTTDDDFLSGKDSTTFPSRAAGARSAAKSLIPSPSLDDDFHASAEPPPSSLLEGEERWRAMTRGGGDLLSESRMIIDEDPLCFRMEATCCDYSETAL